MTATDVFISYARLDRPIARVFAETLIKEGFRVWWDATLHSGETFDEVIEQRLKEAKAVVVLWSPRSVGSRWVRAEATLADRRHKLVPAIIEACDRPIVFELTHAADLAHWRGDRADSDWRMFIDDVAQLVRSGAADENAGAPAAPASKVPAAQAQLATPGPEALLIADQRVQKGPWRRATIKGSVAPSTVHCLEIEEGELPGEVIVVESANVKIGRCPPADIVLSHRSVSREHCVISLVNDELLVADLNSTNGTYVDDLPISQAEVLPVGSVVRLGQISLRHAILTKAEAAPRERTWFQPGRIVAA